MALTLRVPVSFHEGGRLVTFHEGRQVRLLSESDLPRDRDGDGPPNPRPRDARGKHRTWNERSRWDATEANRRHRAAGDDVEEVWPVALGGRIRWIRRADIVTDADRRAGAA